MRRYYGTSIGLLRIIGFLEGLSLIVLVFVAVPLKYYFDNPAMVKAIGPVHGGLFVWFCILVVRVALELEWKFLSTTAKLIISSFIPFGTFYMDHVFLKKEHEKLVAAKTQED